MNTHTVCAPLPVLKPRYSGKESKQPLLLYYHMRKANIVLCWVEWDAVRKRYSFPFISTADANAGLWDKILDECKQNNKLHTDVGMYPYGWYIRHMHDFDNGKHMDGVMVAEAVIPHERELRMQIDNENGRWVLPCEIWNEQWVKTVRSGNSTASHVLYRPFQCSLYETVLVMLKAPLLVGWAYGAKNGGQMRSERKMRKGSLMDRVVAIPNCQYVVSTDVSEVHRWIGLGEVPDEARFCVEEEVPQRVQHIIANSPSKNNNMVWVARYAVWKELCNDTDMLPVLVGFL